jgi:hypothetical protein
VTRTRIAAVLVVILAAVLLLAGCGGPMLVTAKYRSLVGLYFACTGPSYAPCVKGDVWRVSKGTYDSLTVGSSYYNPW